MLEVVERDRALADADRLREPDAARLVAHVRAVGEVVGAEAPHEELVEEGRLVAGAARGVEDRLVRRGERARARCADEREGVVPGDRLVAVARRAGAASARRGGPAPRASGRSARAARRRRAREERAVRRAARSPRRRRPWRRSRRTRSMPRSAGSGQAQPGQSKPSGWFSTERAGSARPRPGARRVADRDRDGPEAAGGRLAPALLARRSCDALPLAVDVEAAAAQEAYQRHAARGRRGAPRGRSAPRPRPRGGCARRGLLDDLEGDASRDEQPVPGERQPPRARRPSR